MICQHTWLADDSRSNGRTMKPVVEVAAGRLAEYCYRQATAEHCESEPFESNSLPAGLGVFWHTIIGTHLLNTQSRNAFCIITSMDTDGSYKVHQAQKS